jgi:hypothetical protein
MMRLSIGRIGLVLAAAVLTAPALAAQQSRPETHTVRSGDTLWDLARRYLGDPFLWPEIYRLNTAVVEDPHWIYPDEVLRLSASGDVASVPTTDTPPPTPRDSAARAAEIAAEAAVDAGVMPAGEDWKKYFSNATGAPGSLSALANRPYQALRAGEFYSSGFLTEGRDLAAGKLLGLVTPSQIPVATVTETSMLHQSVLLGSPRGTAYETGDSLLLVRHGSSISGFGRVVIPTGMVRVTEVAPGRTVGIVLAVYAAIEAGDLILPAEKFTSSGTARAAAVADGVEARVLGGPSVQILKGPQDVLFLDKGSRDGVAAGDIFEVRRAERRRADGAMEVPEVMAVLQVVRVGERSATTRILTVTSPDIADGSGSRQVAKLPS